MNTVPFPNPEELLILYTFKAQHPDRYWKALALYLDMFDNRRRKLAHDEFFASCKQSMYERLFPSRGLATLASSLWYSGVT